MGKNNAVDKCNAAYAKKYAQAKAEFVAKFNALYAQYVTKSNALSTRYSAKPNLLYADYCVEHSKFDTEHKENFAALSDEWQARLSAMDANLQKGVDAARQKSVDAQKGETKL